MECADTVVELGGNLVGLMLVSEIDPPPPEWDRAINRVLTHIHQGKVGRERLRLLTVTQGGYPDTRQRAGLKVAFEGRHTKVSVISAAIDSPIKRGAATALRWINPNIALFPPEQFMKALAHVDLSDHRERILSLYGELERQIRPLSVLRHIHATLARSPTASD